jgi:zinc protease
VACLLSLLAMACVDRNQFPEESFRQRPPPSAPVQPFAARPLQQATLSNGIRVFLEERHAIPVVRLRLIFRGGAATDPPGKTGRSRLCTGLVEYGPEGMDHLSYEAAQARIAARIVVGSGAEHHVSGLRTLARHLDPALDLWTAVLRRPALRAERLRDMTRELTRSLRLQERDAPALASRMRARVAFGDDHPYGRFPSPAALAALEAVDCQRFVAERMQPDGAILLAVGDITLAALVQRLEARFAAWRGKPAAPPTVGPAAPASARVQVVDVPGTVQTVIHVVRRVPTGETLLTADLVDDLIRDRLDTDLRATRGLAYRVRQHLDRWPQGGVSSFSLHVQRDSTGEALTAAADTMKQVRGWRTDANELSRRIDTVLFRRVTRLGAGADLMEALSDLVLADLPLESYVTLGQQAAALTPSATVDRLRQLQDGDFRYLVVGDLASIRPQLDDLTRRQVLDDQGFQTLAITPAAGSAPARAGR